MAVATQRVFYLSLTFAKNWSAMFLADKGGVVAAKPASNQMSIIVEDCAKHIIAVVTFHC